MKKRTRKHPGLMLKEYYLDDMGITPYRLAKEIGVGSAYQKSGLETRRLQRIH